MGQISVLTGPERRRRWSGDEWHRIVAEAFAPGSCVAQVARDHDISTGLIYTWRRRLRQDLADQGFVEAAMEAEPIKQAAPSGEMIVVELTGSVRIRIYGSAPPRVNQTRRNIVIPRNLRHTRSRRKRLRNDPVPFILAPTPPAFRPR